MPVTCEETKVPLAEENPFSSGTESRDGGIPSMSVSQVEVGNNDNGTISLISPSVSVTTVSVPAITSLKTENITKQVEALKVSETGTTNVLVSNMNRAKVSRSVSNIEKESSLRKAGIGYFRRGLITSSLRRSKVSTSALPEEREEQLKESSKDHINSSCSSSKLPKSRSFTSLKFVKPTISCFALTGGDKGKNGKEVYTPARMGTQYNNNVKMSREANPSSTLSKQGLRHPLNMAKRFLSLSSLGRLTKSKSKEDNLESNNPESVCTSALEGKLYHCSSASSLPSNDTSPWSRTWNYKNLRRRKKKSSSALEVLDARVGLSCDNVATASDHSLDKSDPGQKSVLLNVPFKTAPSLLAVIEDKKPQLQSSASFLFKQGLAVVKMKTSRANKASTNLTDVSSGGEPVRAQISNLGIVTAEIMDLDSEPVNLTSKQKVPLKPELSTRDHHLNGSTIVKEESSSVTRSFPISSDEVSNTIERITTQVVEEYKSVIVSKLEHGNGCCKNEVDSVYSVSNANSVDVHSSENSACEDDESMIKRRANGMMQTTVIVTNTETGNDWNEVGLLESDLDSGYEHPTIREEQLQTSTVGACSPDRFIWHKTDAEDNSVDSDGKNLILDEESSYTESFKHLDPFDFHIEALHEGKRERLYKVLVVGELGTGKTSIIKRYVHQFFSQHYRATIGVDFALKVLRWDPDTVVRLQLWDIAGQERFGSMTRVYYKEAVGAFVVFDVTRGATLEAVPKWKADLDAKVVLPDGRPIPTVLLANKSDQPKEGIAANREKMNDFCQQQGFAAWFETSAKDNINIDDSANFLVSKILEMDRWSQEPMTSDPEKLDLGENGKHRAGSSSSCAC